jgi:hypothetical protein
VCVKSGTLAAEPPRAEMAPGANHHPVAIDVSGVDPAAFRRQLNAPNCGASVGVITGTRWAVDVTRPLVVEPVTACES